jgi:hypothetical protein
MPKMAASITGVFADKKAANVANENRPFNVRMVKMF